MKNIYVKTFGCSINQSDSEVMAGLLKNAGFHVILNYSNKSDSEIILDAVIINTCTVKNLAERKFFRELRHWKHKNTLLIVAGCIPQADPQLLESELKDVSVIGTRQVINVVNVVNDTLDGKIVHNIANDHNERLNLPKIRKSNIIEILPISEGCLSKCSYCKTKLSRGNLISYPKEKIISQFKNALADGCKEFWITSQDNGCYGFDIYRKEKYFLPQLLNDLLTIEGDFKIRLGMANPDHILRIMPELICTFKHPKIFKFLHIPVQSGNDKILKVMRRHYTVSQFKDIINNFRAEIPDTTISTDIIVGFPGETEQEFNDSLELVRWLRPSILNLSRFWLRKGTGAEHMEPIIGAISKARGESMKKLFNEIVHEDYSSLISKDFTIMIDEVGKKGTLIGRNSSYRQVIIQNNDLQIGDVVKVKISNIGPYDLRGHII